MPIKCRHTPREIIERAGDALDPKASKDVQNGLLAQKLSMSLRTVYRWRRAESLREMPLAAAMKLADLARIDVREFLR